MDDFDSILNFLIKLESTTTINEKFNLIIKTHNEHRIVFAKLIAQAFFLINGKINFIYLILFGNMALLGITFILFKNFIKKETNNDLIYFLPVVFIIFQLAHHENMFWAMASITNFYVLFFAIASLYFLDLNSKKYFFIACLFAALSTYTCGNGMFTFFAGAAMLIYKKQYRSLLLWGILMTILIAFYFYNYEKPVEHPDITEALLNPFRIISYVLLFLGSLFGKNYFIIPILILCFIIYIFLSGHYKKNIFLSSLFIFILLTSFAAAVTRSGFGIHQALAGRYVINSTLIICIVYLFSLNLFKDYYVKNIYFFIIIMSTVFINIRSYSIKHRTTLKLHEKLVVAKCSHKLGEIYPNIKFAENIIEEASFKKIYEIPKDKCE